MQPAVDKLPRAVAGKKRAVHITCKQKKKRQERKQEMELSEKIQTLRKKEGMSQEAFAEKMNVSRQAVSKWELGVSVPDVDKIVLMSRIFHVTTDYLLKEEEEREKEQTVYIREERWHFEKKSKKTLFGLPLYHINLCGIRMFGGFRGGFAGKAEGILAIGGTAKGIVAIGLIARGILSLGIVSLGIFSLGAISVGVAALGALAAGVAAGGNVAVGIFACGNLAVGIYAMGNAAIGNKIALGNYAQGHIAVGNTVHGVRELVLQDKNFADMDAAQIRQMILEEFPKTWKLIVRLFTMW